MGVSNLSPVFLFSVLRGYTRVLMGSTRLSRLQHHLSALFVFWRANTRAARVWQERYATGVTREIWDRRYSLLVWHARHGRFQNFCRFPWALSEAHTSGQHYSQRAQALYLRWKWEKIVISPWQSGKQCLLKRTLADAGIRQRRWRCVVGKHKRKSRGLEMRIHESRWCVLNQVQHTPMHRGISWMVCPSPRPPPPCFEDIHVNDDIYNRPFVSRRMQL